MFNLFIHTKDSRDIVTILIAFIKKCRIMFLIVL
jgi:hypothetical protein